MDSMQWKETKKTNRLISLNYDNEIYVLDDVNLHMGHKRIDYTARLLICDRNAVVQTQMKPIVYCKTCGKYYITKSFLKQINQRGIPLTKINMGKTGIGNLREESPLKLMGYSVSQKDGLNPKQRHFVLKYILERRYMTKERIISYLKFFIKNPVAGDIAKGKWMDDIRYLQGLT